MKALTYILLVFLIISGCTSTKKLLTRGNYDKVIDRSVKKLIKNPGSEKDAINLDRAYKLANERDQERIDYLKIEGNPDTWDWTFGDGGTSTEQNPVYEYTAVGTYTVTLTVSNAYGSDTETKDDYITVFDVGNTMYVYDMVVGRKIAGPNNSGTCTVTIYDNTIQPVEGATVYVTATGPVGGDYDGQTGADGTVNFQTGKTKNPSGEWCFEVADVTHASYTYDPASNNVTLACESGWINRGGDMVALVVPEEFSVSNYPNPFNPETEIHYTLPVNANVTLEIYNIVGQRIAILMNEMQDSGYHLVTWNASDIPSGVYFYRIVAGEFTATNKMILMKYE